MDSVLASTWREGEELAGIASEHLLNGRARTVYNAALYTTYLFHIFLRWRWNSHFLITNDDLRIFSGK